MEAEAGLRVRLGYLSLLLLGPLIACQQTNYTLTWPGVAARAHTYFGEAPVYHSIGWGGSGSPAFSVVLSDGRTMLPGDFSMRRLESLGATERRRDGSTLSLPAHNTTRTLKIESGAARLYAIFFVETQRLSSIHLTVSSADRESDGEVEVGDRRGRRRVRLPATREELIEVFGEPEREQKSVSTPQFG
jgi:hypothetical protein